MSCTSSVASEILASIDHPRPFGLGGEGEEFV